MFVTSLNLGSDVFLSLLESSWPLSLQILLLSSFLCSRSSRPCSAVPTNYSWKIYTFFLKNIHFDQLLKVFPGRVSSDILLSIVTRMKTHHKLFLTPPIPSLILPTPASQHILSSSTLCISLLCLLSCHFGLFIKFRHKTITLVKTDLCPSKPEPNPSKAMSLHFSLCWRDEPH